MAQFIVKGQVIDGDENLPMPQARVEVVGTDRFTTTDKNGKFEMLVSKGERLKFRFVGYIEKVVHIKRNEFLRVTLNPDCTHHHYHSFSSMRLHAGLDLTNNLLIGRVKPPVIGFYKAISTAYEFNGQNDTQIHRADIKIWDLYLNCRWDLHTSIAYRNYRLPDSDFQFRGTVFSMHVGIDLTEWFVGVGHGQRRVEDQFMAQTGWQFGLTRELAFRVNKVWWTIPVTVKATKWEDFWDIETSLDLFSWPFGLRAGYNRIDSFNQFTLTAAFGIGLSRPSSSKQKTD